MMIHTRPNIAQSNAPSGFNSTQSDSSVSFQDTFKKLTNLTNPEQRRDVFEHIVEDFKKINTSGDKKQIDKAKSQLREYFEKDFKNKNLVINFEGLEKYFSHKHISKDEFFPKIYLFVNAFIDTRNLNTIVKSARDVLKDRQGECDDITFFYHYFAKRLDIEGKAILERSEKVNVESNSVAHVRYYYFDHKKAEMTVMDQDNYNRISFKDLGTNDWKKAIEMYQRDVICANELPSNLADSGKESEFTFIDVTPSRKTCEFFREKNLEK